MASLRDHVQVQVRFFLDHWNEIRASDAMRNVWQEMRLGRHPGFEEGECYATQIQLYFLRTSDLNTHGGLVWPVIALNLEYQPRAVAPAENNERDDILRRLGL